MNTQPKRWRLILDVTLGVTAALALVGLFYRAHGPLTVEERLLFAISDLLIILLLMFHGLSHLFAQEPEQPLLSRALVVDLIVFAPVVAFLRGHEIAPSLCIVVRQAAALFFVLLRPQRKQRLLTALTRQPALMLVFSFAGAIFIGSALLALPISTVSGQPPSVVDAVFTITSATCVTGLTVLDTGQDFSYFGQLVILACIQLGGLGIMTFSVWLLLASGQVLRKHQQALMQTVLDEETIAGIVEQIRFILMMTLVCESVGAVAYFFAWRERFASAGQAAYAAIFHSISAFCNAGFSLFRSSLTEYRGDIPVNLITCALIVIGGLGFFVVRDLWIHLRGSAEGHRPLRLQTRMVLTATAVLICGGAILIFISERRGLLRDLPLHQQAIASLFQSITARTAGFNTLDTARLADSTRLVLLFLMYVGASPGSTGGGIKTTTLWILLHQAFAGMRAHDQVQVGRRALPPGLVQKATAIVFFYTFFLATGSFLLMFFHAIPFRDIVFDATSAIGTVGLSTGAVGQLSEVGKWIMTALMFIGRLGPLTIALVVAGYRPAPRYEYAEETVAVG